MNNPMDLGALVDSYLDKMEGDFKNRTLARKIVDENPGLFHDNYQKEVERVRKAIRYRRGANGDLMREKAEKAGTIREEFQRDIDKPMLPSRQLLPPSSPSLQQRRRKHSKPHRYLPFGRVDC